jgi:WD40 repeat protein
VNEIQVTGSTFCDLGRKIITISEDHTMKVWDSSSYLLIRTLQEFVAPVSEIFLLFNEFLFVDVVFKVSVCAASPGEGKFIAAGSHDGVVKVWDTANLQFIAKLNGHSQKVIFSFCVSRVYMI